MDSKVKQARDGGLIGGYGLDVTRDIQRHLKEKMKVKGKEVFKKIEGKILRFFAISYFRHQSFGPGI